jgi:hypothetical protein
VHAVPHTPQLVALDVTSTQLPVQLVKPAAHWHALMVPLCVQSWPLWHLFPQPPQLFASIDTFKHAPLQLTLPAWHAQLPATQALPTAHEVPHFPQFALLLSSATQVLPHSAWPVGQPARGGELGALLHARGSASAKMKTSNNAWRRFMAPEACHGA